MSNSWKVRPRESPITHFPKEQLDGFVLGPVMEALNRIEFDSASSGAGPISTEGDRPFHPGVLQFANKAVRIYLDLFRSPDVGQLQPVRKLWAAQRVLPTSVWELHAWGRRYESLDGRFREFRFLRFGQARGRSELNIAIAAYVTAFGGTTERPRPWSDPFVLSDPTGAERIRIIDVGLSDGSTKSLFEGSASDAEAYFNLHGRHQLRDVATGQRTVPGFGCADCKRLAVCAGPVKAAGLLGVKASQQAPLRTVSISDLRYYKQCPAQAYLRKLHLPRAYEYSREAELGQAVHAWLEAAHHGGGNPCSMHNLPPAGRDWSAGSWQASGEFAELGRRMLAQHIEICPFRDAPEVDTVRVEPQLTFFDPVARAVVVAKPDLVYRESGQWVWRELKTTQKRNRFHPDPLEEYPQLALGVAVLAAGLLGPGDPGRVELEILRPSGPEIVLIDAGDEEQVTTARRVLHAWAAEWRSDQAFVARPGPNCQWCPVSVWCPSNAGSGAEMRET